MRAHFLVGLSALALLSIGAAACAGATTPTDDGVATSEPTAATSEPTTTPTSDASAEGSSLPITIPDTGNAADWKKPNPNGKADGASCSKPDDCKSGICEGEGCGADTKAVCVTDARPCTRDLRTYCGCDGKTFGGSGSCPGRMYQKAEACKQ